MFKELILLYWIGGFSAGQIGSKIGLKATQITPLLLAQQLVNSRLKNRQTRQLFWKKLRSRMSSKISC